MKLRLLLFLIFISSLTLTAQSLSPGDIAIIGYNSDNPDDLAFLCLVDVPSGTQLNFTDNGWQSSESFRANEGTFIYTFSSNVTAGTVINPTVSGVAFSGSGDQVLVYQGSASSPSFVYGFNNEGAGVWQSNSTSSNTSALPSTLTNGETAVAIDEVDNVIYGGITSGTRAELLAAIGDNSNWSGHNSTRQTMPTGPFSVSTGTPTTPDAPVATTSTNVAHDSFTANWNSSAGATKYYLDVSELSDFSTFITGFNNLDVGNVATYSVTGLTASSDYFYRVRANNSAGTSTNSNTISFSTTAQPSTLVQFKSGSGSSLETSGTFDLIFSIQNPDLSSATLVDVVLQTGDAADVENYSTQTVTFPAGSSADKTLTIDITDDGVGEGNETLTFELQNISGGNSATIGGQSQFNLTLVEATGGDYYDPITPTATGGQLRFELYNLIKDHIEFPYTSSSTDVWDILKKSDEDPSNSNNVILIYTGRSQSKDLNSGVDNNDPDSWNREHVWAKSRGDFGTDPAAGSDAHHLRPADASINSTRSNKDFDDGGTAVYDGSNLTDCLTDSDSWEPRDAVKGDVARMIFYMDVRYEGEAGDPELNIVDYTGASTGAPTIGKLSTLLQWHIDDPVDAFEQNRNDVVYFYQTNRNPFIDHPEWVEKIWGAAAGNGPTIVSSDRNLKVPNEDHDLIISAVVTDDVSVSNVFLKYQLNGGAEQSLSMNLTGSDNYSITLSESIYGNADLLKYYIVAEDGEGNSDYAPFKELFTGITPIATIKTSGSDGRIVYKGVYAKVSGVATVGSGTFSTTSLNVYLQDANDGINIFKSKDIATIIRGNKYTICGIIDQYNGRAEIIPDDNLVDIVGLGAGTLPEPEVLTIDQLFANPENYESKLIVIQHVSKTAGTWPTSVFTGYPNPEITVTDNNGTSTISLVIDKETNIDGTPEPSWPKDVRGIFVQDDDYTPYFDDYQIFPRDIDDIQNDGALPVELTTFSASIYENIVSLNWETATEVNNYGFEIERKQNLDDQHVYIWESIGFINGYGNSNSPKNYDFEDDLSTKSGNFSYRLKQIDIDGKYEYSKVIVVEIGVPTKFEVTQNYPNPFNPTTTISFSIPEKENVTVQIYNMLGEVVQTLVNEQLNSGKYHYEFDASQISSGNYIYRVIAGDNVEIRKMMLLK